MEWSNSRFQLPSTQSSFLQQQSLRPARPRYWYGNGDEDDAQETQHPDTMLQPSRYANDSALATPPSLPSLKTEISNNENGGTLLQSFSSLGMPQLEEATEFQPFFSAQNNGLSDNAFLQPTQQHLPALVPEQPQQTDQLQSQFSPQFGQFPSGMASYYAPTVPPAPSPPLAATRSSVDYFHEGISIMHGVQGAVPTLPSSFGISPSQQPGLEEQSGNFGQDIVHDTSPIVFSASPPSAEAEANLSTRASLTFPAGSYPTRQIFSASAVAEYTPAPTILGAKKRGSGLLEPFAKMATVVEPKFSPDKRKLCSVEGCKSQARAFNRCKRHGGSKRCSSPGCTKSVQSRGLCIRHGGGSRCQESGCTRASQSHGRCKMHGGGRPCIVAGCEKKAHLKRLCRKHGGGAKCCISGCDKWAQRQGMCMTHSKVVDPNIGGDMMLPDRSLSPALSAPDASPSLQFFSDHVPV